jgi:hypothetical protein
LKRARAIAHVQGSMVELAMESPLDLLNKKAVCSMDEERHLIGAKQLPLETKAHIVELVCVFFVLFCFF